MRRFAALCAILLAGPAFAEDRPALLPSRDVDITYQMRPPGALPGAGAMEQRFRWSSQIRRSRTDLRAGLYMIVDYSNHEMWTVRADRQVWLRMKLTDVSAPLLAAGRGAAQAGFDRLGDDQIVGLSCTDWQTRDRAGDKATICVTSDGLMLRARVGDAVLMQATHVGYGSIGNDVFLVPVGYHDMTPTGASRGVGGAP